MPELPANLLMIALAVIGVVGMAALIYRRWVYDRVTIQGRRLLMIDLILLVSMVEVVMDTLLLHSAILYVMRGMMTVGVLTLLITFPGVTYRRR